MSGTRCPGWFLCLALALVAAFHLSQVHLAAPLSAFPRVHPHGVAVTCRGFCSVLRAPQAQSSLLSPELYSSPTTTLFLMEFHRYFLLHAPLGACTYRSHGSQCSWVLGELILFGLSLSQVMRRAHEAREKLLRLGIFRQVDVLIDTCHGRYHGRVSGCHHIASRVTEQS